ncbi:MAG: hypothetical protein AMS27_11910 [Bacteroides sp. SM23_62_1]|nr:MAG: hypothetical protein AMS27_11910 [Bacteroides sp. SM23_62_1]
MWFLTIQQLSTWSGTFSFTTFNDPPSSPACLITLPGNGQSILSWTPNTETDLYKYRIFRNEISPATTLTDSVTGPLPDTFYIDTGVSNGSLYFYRITAVDDAGNESDFSNEAVAVPVVEQGNAVLLDGNDDYVDLGTGNALDNPGSSFTVAGWMYYGTSENDRVIFGSVSDGEDRRISLRSNAFTIQPDGQGYTEVNMDNPVDTGWHHLAGTYDGSNIKIYVDGILKGTQPVNGTLDPVTTNNFIGSQPDYGWHMNGKIDEVCIWNVDLSAEQMRNIIHKPVKANYPGLVALWHFDEPDTFSTVHDASSNMIHGKLMNGASFTESNAMSPFAPEGIRIQAFADHSVTLKWNTSTASDLKNYNIYRDTISPASLFYSSVYGAPPDTIYIDPDVDFSRTYYYRITAVDSSENESEFSGELIVGGIIVDGIKDPFWQTVTAHIHLGQNELVYGEMVDENDFSADLYLAYDSVYLYGFLEVKDDSVSSKSYDNWWENDAFSLKLDPVPDSIVTSLYQWDEPNWRDIINIEITALAEGEVRNGNGQTIISRALSNEGYVVEFAVSADGLFNNNTSPPEAVLLKEGNKVGFYFEMADQDKESYREAMLAWGHQSVSYNSVANVTHYGSLTFLAGNQIQLSHENLVMSENQPYLQAPDITSDHWLVENVYDSWSYYFYVYASDPQGPGDIDTVWAVGPDGSRYQMYDDGTNGDDWPGGDGRFHRHYSCDSPLQTGEYKFYVKDKSGNSSMVSDYLTANLPCPMNLKPAHNSIISDPDFLIEWDEVPGVINYYVEVNLLSNYEQYWWLNVHPDSSSARYNYNGEGKDLLEGEVYYLQIHTNDNKNASHTRVRIAYMIQSNIVIDGIKDPYWDIISSHIHLGEEELVWGEGDNANDFSADVYLAYDSVYFYGLIEVKDDLIESKSGWWWDNDAISIKFDADPGSIIPVPYNTGQDPNGRDIVSIDFTALTGVDDERNGNESTILGRALTDTGYVIEFAVSAAGLVNYQTQPPENILLQEGTQVGFYIEISDQDLESWKEAVIAWGHTSANPISGMNVTQFGSLIFLPDNQLQLSRENLVMSADQPFIQVPCVQTNHSTDQYANEWWDISFYVYANTQQGLNNIDSVWVEGPGGDHYRLYDNNENCDDYSGDGKYHFCQGLNNPPMTGIYHFHALDRAGNKVSVSDTVFGILNPPKILTPLNNTFISESDFLIEWEDVTDATSYWINIYQATNWENCWNQGFAQDQTSTFYNENGSGRALVKGEIYYLTLAAGNPKNSSHSSIKFTYADQGLIAIDGIKDPFWETAGGHIHLGDNEVVWGDINDENDCSADVYLAYDSLFLYGLIEAKDDMLGSEHHWWWDNDACAFRFDIDPATLVTEQNASDILSLEFTARADADDRRDGNEYTMLSHKLTGTGYVLEFAISAKGLINTSPTHDEVLELKQGTRAGFLFEMADKDSLENKEAELVWGHYSVNLNSRDNVAQYGNMTLMADNQVQFSHDNLVMDEYQPFIHLESFYSNHYKNAYLNEGWDVHFGVFINDPQGLEDIDSVWVESPDGTVYMMTDGTDGGGYPGDGIYTYGNGFNTPLAIGEYYFYVVDKTGNTNSVTDTLVEYLDCPDILAPANNLIITNSEFSIEWEKVPGALSYWIDIAWIENGEENWFWHAGSIDTNYTSYQYDGQELNSGKIYTIQVSAYKERTSSSSRIIFAYRTDNHQKVYVNHVNMTGIEQGSANFPFNTIQEGINATMPGDTVLVFPGVYMENLNIYNTSITLGSLAMFTNDTSIITKTIVDGNQNGSVISIWDSWDTITICGFTITNGSNEHGGGLNIWDSNVHLYKLKITDNTANSCGGGICGGICCSVNLIIDDVLIQDNSSSQGGGIYLQNGTLEITNLRLLNNYSHSGGSAILLINNELSMLNTVIAKNQGFQGIEMNSVQGSILNSTIAYNPDGAWLLGNSDISIWNSIEWNNTQNNSGNPDSIQYSLIEGGASGAGNISVDPMFVNADAGDYRLKIGSPCINHGIPDTTGLKIPLVDLAGNPRISQGRIDMGAYEFNAEMIAFIPYADTAPAIDGVITENIWQCSEKYHINKIFTEEVFDSPDDLSAYWKAVWDADGLYFLVEVFADDTLVTDGSYGEIYEQDRVAIFLDMNTDSLKDGIGPSTGISAGNPTNGHYQFSFYRRAEFATLLEWQVGCEIAILEDEEDATSVQELFIPWSLITDKNENVFTPGENISIGFDVYIADNDGPENGLARNRKVWVHDGTSGDFARTNMDHCGKIQLTGQKKEELKIKLSASNLTICPGDEVQLDVIPDITKGTYYYTWTSDQPGPSYSFSNPVVSPVVTTTYYVHVTDLTLSTVDSLTITVLPLPVVNAGADTNILYNTAVTLRGLVSGGSGFYSYNWSPENLFDYPFLQNPTTHNLQKSGLFTLQATDYQTGCSNTDQVLVILTGGTLDAGISVSSDTICPGDSIKLLALPTGGTGYYNYSWSSDPEGFVSSIASPSDIPAGSITYYVLISDTVNSDFASKKVVIHTVGEPEAADVSTCFGEPQIQLIAKGNNILWYDDITLNNIINTGDTLWVESSTLGQYSFYATQTDKRCVSPPAEVNLNIIELPDVTVNLSEAFIEPGETVRLIASSTDNYFWTPSDGLDRTDGDTVRASPSENTKYTVTGTNDQGCSNTAEISVYVYCEGCEQQEIIFDTAGVINYCPTNRVYPDNADCSWLIYPSGAKSIYLYFDSIDIKPGDYIRLYDGFDINSELIGAFNNDNPPSGQIQSGSMLFIRFQSNTGGTGLGFRARFRVNNPVGIEQSEFISGLNIYPNPVTGLMNIEFTSKEETEFTISVYNTLMQLLNNKKIQVLPGRNREVLDMTGLPPGVYFLQISSKGRRTVRKIIVR